MSSIWDSCLSRLENEISSNDLNTWIRPLQAEEEKDVIKLLAPNQFIIAYVQEHFLSKIEDAVYEFSSGQYQAKIGIGTKSSEEDLLAKYANTQSKEKEKQAEKQQQPHFINTAFTFDNFVEGPSNQLAKVTSLQVSKDLGGSYNPLLIYGASGLGKTHLMHAIGNSILHKNPDANIVYLTSEKFVQEMVQAFQHKKIDHFKKYYRSVDALFIDDIQFLAGKERSQEEFFHTFNSLLENNKQVVLTSDKYPKEIQGLEERLKSRLGWGLPVAVQPPDLETRTAILINKAKESNVVLNYEVAFFIAKRIPFNVRDLEGALRRVIANAQFTDSEITIDFAKIALHDLISLQDKLVSIDNIQKTVADYFKLKVADLLSKSRKQTVTRPRQIAMSLARELTRHSLPEVGVAFGGRDHTTVMSACKRVETLRASNQQMEEDYSNLLKSLSQ